VPASRRGKGFSKNTLCKVLCNPKHLIAFGKSCIPLLSQKSFYLQLDVHSYINEWSGGAEESGKKQ